MKLTCSIFFTFFLLGCAQTPTNVAKFSPHGGMHTNEGWKQICIMFNDTNQNHIIYGNDNLGSPTTNLLTLTNFETYAVFQGTNNTYFFYVESN